MMKKKNNGPTTHAAVLWNVVDGWKPDGGTFEMLENSEFKRESIHKFLLLFFLCLIMLLGWVVRLLDVLFYWIYRYCGHGNAVFVVFLVNLRWFYAYVLQLIWNVCAIGKIFDFQNAVYLSYVHESLALPCKVSYMVKSAWIWFNNLTMIELIPSYVHNTRI